MSNKKKKARRRGRSLFALFMVVVLLGMLGAGAWYGVGRVREFFTVKDYQSAGYGQVVVQVKKGDTATDIANTLYQKNVVRSSQAFLQAAKENTDSRKIEDGYYQLRLHMRASDALTMLLARKADNSLANRVSTRVTLTEGMISVDVYKKLSDATGIPVTEFQKYDKQPVALGIPDWWFKRQDGKQAVVSLEGFLYPATYDFDPGADAKTILTTIVNNFLQEMTKLDFPNQAQKLNISPYEALVAASIEQVEARTPQDMAGVARVLYNRAYGGKFACSCLELDSEVNYWLRISGKQAQSSNQLTLSQLHDPNDPYNTHDKPGLPIGAISNPGEDALKGAINPPKNDNVYFLTIDKNGTTGFATNQTQFNQLVQQACKNGVDVC